MANMSDSSGESFMRSMELNAECEEHQKYSDISGIQIIPHQMCHLDDALRLLVFPEGLDKVQDEFTIDDTNKIHFKECITLSRVSFTRNTVSELPNSSDEEDASLDYHLDSVDFLDTVLNNCERRRSDKELRNIVDDIIKDVLNDIEAEELSEKMKLIGILKEYHRKMRSTCEYCHNVTFNTVNGREFALHILKNHRFATLEVGPSEVVAESLKFNLNYLENVFCSNQDHLDFNDEHPVNLRLRKVMDEPKILINKWIIPSVKDKIKEIVDELPQIKRIVDEIPQIKIKNKRIAHHSNSSMSEPKKRKIDCNDEEINNEVDETPQTMKKHKITVYEQGSSKNIMPSNNDTLQQNNNQPKEAHMSCDEDEEKKKVDPIIIIKTKKRIAHKEEYSISRPKKTKIAYDEEQTQNKVDQCPQTKTGKKIIPHEKREATSYNNTQYNEPQLPDVSVKIQKPAEKTAKPRKGKSKLIKIKHVLNKYNPNGR